jgi:hypothetical protein
MNFFISQHKLSSFPYWEKKRGVAGVQEKYTSFITKKKTCSKYMRHLDACSVQMMVNCPHELIVSFLSTTSTPSSLLP